jgi:hypothetical protein
MDVLLIRNLGEDRKGLGKGQGVKEEKKESTTGRRSSLPESRFHIVFQDQSALKHMPKMHPNTVWVGFDMVRKVKR